MPDAHSNSNQYQAKLNALQSEKNEGSKKVIYSLFSSTEKLKFWQDHFIIASKLATVKSDAQKMSLISELSSYLTNNVFEDNSDEQNIFLAYNLPTWLKKAESIFHKTELSDLLLSNFQESNPQIDNTIKTKVDYMPEDPVDCFCHVGNTGYSCKQLQVGFPSGVTQVYGMCEEGNRVCKTSNRGCGFLWLEKCNGSHCNY